MAMESQLAGASMLGQMPSPSEQPQATPQGGQPQDPAMKANQAVESISQERLHLLQLAEDFPELAPYIEQAIQALVSGMSVQLDQQGGQSVVPPQSQEMLQPNSQSQLPY